MMFKKVVSALMINLIWVCSLSAELNWWRVKEISALNGCTDSYAIAMNRHGKAIALFDDKILGSYDANHDRWEFCQITYDVSGMPVLGVYTGSGSYEFSIGKPSKGNVIVLSDNNDGWALFIVPTGEQKGRIGIVHYSSRGWEEPVILSDEAGSEPTMVQGYDGRLLVAWINRGQKSEQNGKLMAASYVGSKWVKQGVISKYKSIEMDYNQIGPQLAMSNLGDAVLVWKVENSKKKGNKKEVSSQDALLVAHYFDGVEEKWCGDHIIGKQPIEKKGRDLQMSDAGEILFLWDTEKGIEVSTLNLMKYMIFQSGWTDPLASLTEPAKVDVPNPWTVSRLVEGEELSMPKACMNHQGNVVAVWLEGYSGMRSAYFDSNTKSWEVIPEPITTQAAYTNTIQLDGVGKGWVLWVGEGPSMSEVVSSRAFDFSTKTWTPVRVLNNESDNSLIDTVDACSLAKASYGIVMWYDFFKEKLFYAVLRAEEEPVRNIRRESILYKKKQALSERRLQRGLH